MICGSCRATLASSGVKRRRRTRRIAAEYASFDADAFVENQNRERLGLMDELIACARGEGLEKPDILERLHLWYGRDRGVAPSGVDRSDRSSSRACRVESAHGVSMP